MRRVVRLLCPGEAGRGLCREGGELASEGAFAEPRGVQLQLKESLAGVGEEVSRHAVGARAGIGDLRRPVQAGGERERVSRQEEAGVVDEIAEMPGRRGVVDQVGQDVGMGPFPVRICLWAAGYVVEQPPIGPLLDPSAAGGNLDPAGGRSGPGGRADARSRCLCPGRPWIRGGSRLQRRAATRRLRRCRCGRVRPAARPSRPKARRAPDRRHRSRPAVAADPRSGPGPRRIGPGSHPWQRRRWWGTDPSRPRRR